MVTGPSTKLVVGAVVVDFLMVGAAVVKSCWCQSMGLVEEVNQNKAVMA